MNNSAEQKSKLQSPNSADENRNSGESQKHGKKKVTTTATTTTTTTTTTKSSKKKKSLDRTKNLIADSQNLATSSHHFEIGGETQNLSTIDANSPSAVAESLANRGSYGADDAIEVD